MGTFAGFGSQESNTCTYMYMCSLLMLSSCDAISTRVGTMPGQELCHSSKRAISRG